MVSTLCFAQSVDGSNPVDQQAVQSFIEKAIKINDTLLGLPALPTVLLGCIVFGYMMKLVPIVPNKWIPTGVFGFGIAANIAMSVMSSSVTMISCTRGVILGMVAGFASIVIHQKYLRNWIDVNSLQSGDTKFRNNPNLPTPPPDDKNP